MVKADAHVGVAMQGGVWFVDVTENGHTTVHGPYPTRIAAVAAAKPHSKRLEQKPASKSADLAVPSVSELAQPSPARSAREPNPDFVRQRAAASALRSFQGSLSAWQLKAARATIDLDMRRAGADSQIEALLTDVEAERSAFEASAALFEGTARVDDLRRAYCRLLDRLREVQSLVR